MPAEVTAFAVDEDNILLVTVATSAAGYDDRTSAATPATCGAAIEVPEMVLIAVFDDRHADVIDTPGAKISRHVPKFENDARASVDEVAPTVIAATAREGD